MALVSVARGQAEVQAGVIVSIKPADLLQVVGFSLCALASVLSRSGAWEDAAGIFLFLAAGSVLLRAAAHHWRSNFLSLCADFFPTLAIILSYGHLDPVCDFFHLPLADSRLMHIDQQLFGMQPSVVLAAHLTPALSDVLMACYCSYYLWPLVLGVLLYVRRGEAAFDRWSFAVLMIVLLNYACYMAVPAIGPRFTLTTDFAGPVQGVLAAPMFAAFLHSPYHRDCFPSGHTALTLMVLWHAFRVLRPFFWVILPTSLGLIVATVALRFHYGVDLIAAVPLAAIAYALSNRLFDAAPQGIALLSQD